MCSAVRIAKNVREELELDLSLEDFEHWTALWTHLPLPLSQHHGNAL